MKIPKIKNLLNNIALISLLATAFPAMQVNAVLASPMPQVTATNIGVEVTQSVTENISATSAACFNNDNGAEVRLDYMLNTNCGYVVILALPIWPKVSVVKNNASTNIVAQKLPVPPSVRWVNAGTFATEISIAFLSNSSSNYYRSAQNIKYTFVQNKPLINFINSTKTLAELQVQRC